MKILDKEIPLLENLKQSYYSYWYLWLILIISIMLDSLSTVLFMQDEGIVREANVLIYFLAETFGIIVGVIIGKSLQLIAAIGFAALSYKYSPLVLVLLSCLNLLAFYHNLGVL